jgi:3-hydroxy-9,10-secoandrosta-1,3,5(10)-triene-9,17-dione monooxygenase reductase component
MPRTSPSSDNSKALRNALGSFATGVTIVTALDSDQNPIGMTVNSFNSVSLNPPLILWSISKDSNCFDDFIKSETFAVHVLNHNQEDLSNRFAESGGNKFLGLSLESGFESTPILPDFSACFECKTEHQYDGGDHIILVGRVVSFEDRETDPLVFYRGQYKTI